LVLQLLVLLLQLLLLALVVVAAAVVAIVPAAEVNPSAHLQHSLRCRQRELQRMSMALSNKKSEWCRWSTMGWVVVIVARRIRRSHVFLSVRGSILYNVLHGRLCIVVLSACSCVA
jgi:hypothetical protein